MNNLNQLFPNYLKKMFLKVTVINYINMAIGIITSILTVRLIGSSAFGSYQYCLALTEFPSVFYNSFDRIINRFISLSPEENHHKMVYSSLFIHAVASILIFAFFILCFCFPVLERTLFTSIANPEGRKILLFSLGITFISGIFNTMTTYLSGIRKIETSQTVTMISHMFGLISLSIIYIIRSKNTDVIIWSLGIKLVTLSISILWVFLKFKSFFKNVFISFKNPVSNFGHLNYTIQNFFTDYAFHFQINEIFGYFKDRIGILILGHFGSFSNVAFYDVLKNIIAIPRKYFSQMFTVFISKIVHSYTHNKDKFEKRFKYFCYLQYIATSVIAIILMLSISLFIRIYSFENLKDYYYLAFFECLTLILTSWANNNNFSLELQKDSKGLMQSATGRGLIIGFLSPYMILKFEVRGAAIALLVSTIFIVIFLCIRNKADSLWRMRDNFNNFKIFCVFALILYFLINFSFGLYKYLGP